MDRNWHGTANRSGPSIRGHFLCSQFAFCRLRSYRSFAKLIGSTSGGVAAADREVGDMTGLGVFHNSRERMGVNRREFRAPQSAFAGSNSMATNRRSTRTDTVEFDAAGVAQVLVKISTLMGELSGMIAALLETPGRVHDRSAASARSVARAEAGPDHVAVSNDELLQTAVRFRMSMLGYDQGDLARRMQVADSFVSRLLKRPSAARPSTWKRVAKALDCTVRDLHAPHETNWLAHRPTRRSGKN